MQSGRGFDADRRAGPPLSQLGRRVFGAGARTRGMERRIDVSKLLALTIALVPSMAPAQAGPGAQTGAPGDKAKPPTTTMRLVSPAPNTVRMPGLIMAISGA